MALGRLKVGQIGQSQICARLISAATANGRFSN